jgi:hypothetical protein
MRWWFEVETGVKRDEEISEEQFEENPADGGFNPARRMTSGFYDFQETADNDNDTAGHYRALGDL